MTERSSLTELIEMPASEYYQPFTPIIAFLFTISPCDGESSSDLCLDYHLYMCTSVYRLQIFVYGAGTLRINNRSLYKPHLSIEIRGLINNRNLSIDWLTA